MPSDQKPVLIRYLLAVAFVVFCVTGIGVWIIPNAPVPWWTPFACALAVPSIVGGAILILGGFHE